MSPVAKLAVKCVLFGLAGALASLQANLPGVSVDDLVQAAVAGGILGLSYAGIGAATSLEEPGKKIV